MRSGGGLGSFWAALGPLLGVIWLRAPCGPLPGCLLGSSWAVLEASWAPLGRLLGRLGHQVGASWGLLEVFGGVWLGFLRSESFFIFGFLFWYTFGSRMLDFGSIFASRLAFSWFFPFRAETPLSRFRVRFWCQFGIIVLPKIDPGTS